MSFESSPRPSCTRRKRAGLQGGDRPDSQFFSLTMLYPISVTLSTSIYPFGPFYSLSDIRKRDSRGSGSVRVRALHGKEASTGSAVTEGCSSTRDRIDAGEAEAGEEAKPLSWRCIA